MNHGRVVLKQFLQNEDAATAVEYAVMLSLVIMTLLASIAVFGLRTSNLWSDIMAKLQAAGFI